MNRVERDELLSAASETLGGGRWGRLKRLCARLDAHLPEGRWRLRLGARSAWDAPELEFLPALARAARLTPPLAALLGAKASAERAPDALAWLVLVWDARQGRVAAARVRVAAGEQSWRAGRVVGRRVLARRAWRATRFADPALAASFAALSRLCPLAESWSAAGADADAEWSLRLAAPEPWPRFLRLDQAAAFGPGAGVSSLLLLGRRVEELGYRGDEARVAVG